LSETKQINISPDKAECLAEFDEDKRGIPFAILYEGNTPIAKNRLFDKRFYEMDWSVEKPVVYREQKQAVFSAQSFIWCVCIDLLGEEALYDNFFDIFPGEEHRIDWPEDKALPKIEFYGNLTGYQ